MAGTYYGNSARTNGSVLENMFLLRDATGLRNMTVGGLSGTLGPANVMEQNVQQQVLMFH